MRHSAIATTGRHAEPAGNQYDNQYNNQDGR